MLTWEMTIRLHEYSGTPGVYASIKVSVHRLSPAGNEDEMAAMRSAGLERSPDLPNLYRRAAAGPGEVRATLKAVAAWLRSSGGELAVTWDFDTPDGEVRWPAVPVGALGL